MNNYIGSFKKFKSLLESNSLGLYEQINNNSRTLNLMTDSGWKSLNYKDPKMSDAISSLYDKLMRITGHGILGKSAGKRIGNALMEGIYKRTIFNDGTKLEGAQKKWLRKNGFTQGWDSFIKFLQNDKYANRLDIVVSDGKAVKINFVQGSTPSSTVIPCIGKLKTRTGPLTNADTKKNNGSSTVIKYVDNLNCTNFKDGFDEQYNIEATGLENGRLNLSTKVDDLTRELIFYTRGQYKAGDVSREEEEGKTTIIGAKIGGKGAINIGFLQGKFQKDDKGTALDSNHPIIQAEAQKILGALLEKGDYVDSMTLTSSASPEWGALKTMADYADKTTSGTGDPGVGTDDASNNAKLAFNRGNQLALALSKALGNKLGKPITVNWKISSEGINKGRNVTYSWNKENDPGREETTQDTATSDVSGGTTISGAKAGLWYQYNIDFDTNVMVR